MEPNLDPVMAAANPSVLADFLFERGFSADEIFMGTGLEESFLSSPYNPVKYSQCLKLINRAILITGNPRLGLEIGKRLGISGQGLIGLARISSSTLEGFLTFSGKAVTVTQPSVALDMFKDQETGIIRLELSEIVPWGDARQFYIDYLFSSMAQNIKVFAPDHAHTVTYNSTSPADSDLGIYKDLLYSELINFDQSFLSLEFPRSMIEAPTHLRNPLTVRQGEELVRQLITTFESHYDPFILHVRLIILKNKSRTPNAARVAERLGISLRTLHRHLAHHGTSFQKLTIECQMSIAISLLGRENYPIVKIAERLGYSQASNFGVAFKKWTGLTPAEYRHQLAARN